MGVTFSILLAVVLVIIGIPFWISLGLATALLLWSTGVMPMQLIGEALFEGVDSFALIAIPLFVLTGDVMVRSGLAYRLLNFAEASFGSFRSGFGTATVMGCGLFACISGSDAADAAAIGRITMDKLQEKGYPKPLCLRTRRRRRLHRHPDPALDRLHHHWPGARHLVIDAVPGGIRARRHDPRRRDDHQRDREPHPRLRKNHRPVFIHGIGSSR